MHVYPIVRIDPPIDPMYPTNTITVVKVLTSQEAAEQEVLRLNTLKAGDTSLYFYCTSRLVESGDSHVNE
jgi:Pyruvate/2-oxoacid:ferredoxin oxidoreductase gamma subunit